MTDTTANAVHFEAAPPHHDAHGQVPHRLGKHPGARVEAQHPRRIADDSDLLPGH